MKLKSVPLIAASLALVSAMSLPGCAVATNALEAVWEADCNSKTRYQTPTDRPYITREVTIQGGAPDVMLAGELTMPNGPGPFPGAVLISGSELADRNSFILGHKTFLVLADYLTRRGYAVYRHDDRGYGESTGDPVAALDTDFSADSAAALKWLRSQPGIDVGRVGYIGHSQGAYKAVLATEIEKSNFMISLAGGVEGFGGTLLRQGYDISKALGASEDALEKQQQDVRKILGILRSSETIEEAKTRIEQYGHEEGTSKKQSKQVAEAYATPWMMAAIKGGDDMYAEVDTETESLLKSYNEPILAIYGGKDLLVSSSFNAPRTGPLLIHNKSKVVTFPDMNHFMQMVPPERKDRNITEVCDIDMTFDPQVLETIGEWLDETVR